MIKIKSIIGTSWQQITTAGQQGSCWIYINKRGSGGVMISHSTSGAPTNKAGFRLYKPNRNTEICIIGPDTSKDIYYARCLRRRDRVKLCVDVI